MGLRDLVKRGVVEVWDDVFDVRLDDKAAPNLSDVYLGREKASIYAVPEEFFKRTYITRSMRELMEEIVEALKGGKGGRIFLLTSLFGGGKTHTLMTIYHAFSSPEKLRALDEGLAAKVAELGKPEIIVMDASSSRLVPHPEEPYKAEGFTIKTIWGMLAYRLGAYARVRHLDSEDSPAPDVDLLRALFSEVKGPVLILLDEIIHYVFNMYRSRLEKYGDKVVLFLDYLARAVESSPNVVLVVSIQAEYRVVEGQKVLFEEEMFKGYAGKVYDVLSRETTRIIVPVVPDDVVKVLQKRIFRKIPEEEAWRARDRLYKVYRENPELFGVESDWQFSPGELGRVATAKETYPFHPKYVEVLQEFVTRNKDLQKTRDAIRITRKVVRSFLRGTEDADFIMPWHISLKNNDIRSRVLTENYREFRDVVNRDVVSEEGKLGSVVECSKPKLALMIATAILLKTYTYETFKEPLKVFPDLKGVALMVYEPETFGSENWQPSDIKTILEEMQGRLPHFAAESGRYWFTPYPSVIEYVEKKAAEMLRGPKLTLYRFLADHARGILVRESKRKKKTLAEFGEVFSRKNTIIIGYGDEVWKEVVIDDDPSLKLVVLVKPDVDEESVRDIILMGPHGGRRTFRNTVAVVCPSWSADFNVLLGYAARIKAAEEVRGALSEYYKDKEIRSLQERKLKSYIQNNVMLLQQQLLTTLTRVYYPVKIQERDDVKCIDAVPSSSIILQVEAALKDPRTGPKLRTDFSFNDLVEFLRRSQGWDLVEGEKRFEFKDILRVFYTTAAAPFTTREAVEQAVRQGVEGLDIGVKVDGKLYWKRVGPGDGADEPPRRLSDSAEILPYRLAAEELKERLLAESGVERALDGVRRVWYEVELAGTRVQLKDLIGEADWEKVLKEGVILRQEEVLRRGFMLGISPSSLSVKPGEEVKVAVSVEPVNEYSEEVELKVDKGDLSECTGRVPFSVEWNVGVLDKPGNYKFVIEAVGSDGTVKKEALTVTVLSPEKEVEVNRIDLTYTGAKLLKIVPRDLVSLRIAMDVVSKLNLNAKVDVSINFGRGIRFKGEGMDTGIARIFVQKFDEILRSLTQLGTETSVESTVRFEEPVVLESSRITAFVPLNDRAIFRLRVKRE